MVCYEKNKTSWDSLYDGVSFNTTWGDNSTWSDKSDGFGFYDNSTNVTEKCDY